MKRLKTTVKIVKGTTMDDGDQGDDQNRHVGMWPCLMRIFFMST